MQAQVYALRLLTDIVRNLARGRRTLDEFSGRFRSLCSDDNRAVTSMRRAPIEKMKICSAPPAESGPTGRSG